MWHKEKFNNQTQPQVAPGQPAESVIAVHNAEFRALTGLGTT